MGFTEPPASWLLLSQVPRWLWGLAVCLGGVKLLVSRVKSYLKQTQKSIKNEQMENPEHEEEEEKTWHLGMAPGALSDQGLVISAVDQERLEGVKPLERCSRRLADLFRHNVPNPTKPRALARSSLSQSPVALQGMVGLSNPSESVQGLCSPTFRSYAC